MQSHKKDASESHSSRLPPRRSCGFRFTLISNTITVEERASPCSSICSWFFDFFSSQFASPFIGLVVWVPRACHGGEVHIQLFNRKENLLVRCHFKWNDRDKQYIQLCATFPWQWSSKLTWNQIRRQQSAEIFPCVPALVVIAAGNRMWHRDGERSEFPMISSRGSRAFIRLQTKLFPVSRGKLQIESSFGSGNPHNI